MRTANGSRHQPRRRQEGGFALLVIFLIAAAVAFTMYQELPRAAFESARDKEQLLMDRGNQYKRAIQVYYAVNKRYPAELKDLENTNDKRFLRRRYKDPMTGEDEWRLVHTNGSFLTDSLVEKPPAQNAKNGVPGAGQTPGEGPLGANNMNTAPAAPTASNPADANNPNNPAFAVNGFPQNPAAQRRPSDRGFPTGPGFPQPPGFNPANQNQAAGNPFGANPANFNPNDPSTWPPITLAPPSGQPGQQPRPGQPQPNAQMTGGQPAAFNQPFGGGQPGGAGQPFPGQAFPGQPFPGQTSPGQAFPAQTSPGQGFPGQAFPGQPGQLPPQAQSGGPGQLAGLGGANPQPMPLGNSNPLGSSPSTGQFGNQNPGQVSINQDGQLTPLANQFAPAPQPQPEPGQQPFSGGPPFNGGQPFSAGQPSNQSNGFNPQAAAPFQRGNAAGGQPGTANVSGNAPDNAALQAINNGLFRPNQAPAAGPTGSPGIAGVASKFEGPSIKAYRERTKYQEWEFVYQPTANLPGQAGMAGQNPQQNQNGLGQGGPGQSGLSPSVPGQSGMGPGLGQTPAGGAANPFSQPNPFSPQSPAR